MYTEVMDYQILFKVPVKQNSSYYLNNSVTERKNSGHSLSTDSKRE